MEPNQPAITPAMIAAAVVALIAPIADLLHTFGVYDLTAGQQSAVTKMIFALAGLAAVIVAADAYLRGKRNDARATILAAPTGPDVAASPGARAVTAWTDPRPGAAMSARPAGSRRAKTVDEPGDPDALPEIPTATNVPPDGDDQAVAIEATDEKLAHTALAASYSKLDEADRAIARRLFVKGVEVLITHPAQLHYSQDMVARWEGITQQIVPWTSNGKLVDGRYPRHGDCSSTGTYLLWLALAHHFHLPDLANGEAWQAGYTGTLITHGKPVHDWSQLRVGDAVIYGPSVSATEHVAWSIGGRRVFSHGSEAGPFLLDFEYRSDIVGIRRYI